MYRIHQIKLALDEPQEKIPEKILKKIGGRDFFIKEWEIVKESIDARDKNHIVRVYSVDFNVASRKNPKKNLRLPSAGKLRLEIAPDMRYVPAEPAEGAAPLAARPVVVGLGPAGLFCGLILAQAGYRPLILERGKDVDQRHEDVDRFWSHGVLNPDSNVQFGEGGAGTFSDGKLTTGIKDVRIRKVLEEMVAAGAPKDILYKQRPHIGTDLLRIVVKNIRQEIIRLGGEVRFSTRMEAVHCGNGSVQSITIRDLQNDRLTELPCQALVLAVGHSARDTFRMLHESGIAMEQKPFSIGVRIEHPQDLIDISQYGRPGRQLGLPPAEYKINYRCASGGQGPAAGRGVYTFCMCPGGQVIVASSREGGVVTNGMSYHDRDSGIANSALLCDVRTDDFGSSDVLAGVAFQEKYEHLAFEAGRRQNPDGKPYSPPQTTWGRLRDGLAPEVEACLPAFAVAAFREAMPQLGRKLHGFDAEDAVMTAVETRSSSPVRILRGETYESAAGGLYPCGEGAGYAGGITSAAVDGIRVAEAIIKAYTPALG